MTRKKVIFYVLIVLQAAFFAVYLSNRWSLSQKSARKLILVEHYAHEPIYFPSQPDYFSERQIWLMNKTLDTLHQIRDISGHDKFRWSGLLDSFTNSRADQVKREFWSEVFQRFPEVGISGEYSEEKYIELVAKKLPAYFAEYWILMSPKYTYFSYDLFGYLTNVEISAYFSRVSVENRMTTLWGKPIDFQLIHLYEDYQLESLNFLKRSDVFLSYAFCAKQGMYLDDAWYGKYNNCNVLVNEYQYQIMSKDPEQYREKFNHDLGNNIALVRNLWAIEHGNCLYDQYGDIWAQSMDRVIAHEVAHVYDMMINTDKNMNLPWPYTLHRADAYNFTYSVYTEYNAFASEVINSGCTKESISDLICHHCPPSPKDGLAYPHNIGKNRLFWHMVDKNDPSLVDKILGFQKYFHQPDEYLAKVKEMKNIYESEMGEKYYYKSQFFYWLQYNIFLLPLIYISIVIGIYRKYVCR